MARAIEPGFYDCTLVLWDWGRLGGQKKNKSAKAEIVVQEITVWQHSPDFYGIMAAHLKKSVVTVVDKERHSSSYDYLNTDGVKLD